ncbi:MAG: hypothetical protein Harvfovirus2_63 [Harvfovirus sp.]|uniref:Uncharacterized protein n=1 Tax=Harvfovirus sp. TaxID=2487768 RepID=A0A3G5A3X7_9VIRU|nr:MAG: hypothetical protein Harvfovirus2_63 [Harvfovirus sp.]
MEADSKEKPIRAQYKVPLIHLSEARLLEKLGHSLEKKNNLAIDEIAYFLLRNHTGSFDTIRRTAIKDICELLAKCGRIDLIIYLEKHLPEDRIFRYKMMRYAGINGHYHVLRHFFSLGNYPSETSGETEMDLFCHILADTLLKTNIEDNGDITWIFAPISSKEKKSERVQIAMEMINLNPNGLLDSIPDLHTLRRFTCVNDLVELATRLINLELDLGRLPGDVEELFLEVAIYKSKKICDYLLSMVVPLYIERIPHRNIVSFFFGALEFLIKNDSIEMFSHMFSAGMAQIKDTGMRRLFLDDVFENGYRINAPKIVAYLLPGYKKPDLSNKIVKLEFGRIAMLEVLLVANKMLVKPNVHYMNHYLNTEKNFFRCFFLWKKGVDLTLIEGFGMIEFNHRRNIFSRNIMRFVTEGGVKIERRPTLTNIGIYDIIVGYMFDLNCPYYNE